MSKRPIPLAVRLLAPGMGLFVAGAVTIGNMAPTSRLYHGWVLAGTALLVLLVGVAAASWTRAFRSQPQALVSAVLTPLAYFGLLFAIAKFLPDAYVVEYPAPIQLENYDVAIIVGLGGMAALAVSPVLAISALLWSRLRIRLH